MYSSSLSIHCCIRVLHCSKQCYSSSTPRPFSSCAVFAFTSSTDGKWVPFSTLFTLVYREKSQGAKSANIEDVQVFEYVYWEETTRAKGRGALSWCSIQILFFQIGRFFRKVCRTVSLLIPTMSAIILILTSSFANSFTDFLNVLVGFQTQRVTWIVNHLLLLPDPH